MRKSQWAIFVVMELLLIFLVGLRPSREMLILFIFMNLDLLAIRKGHLIKNDLFKGAKWFRRTVYFVPYLLVFVFFIPAGREGRLQGWAPFLAAVFIGVCFLLPRFKELRNLFNRQFIALYPPQKLGTVMIESYSLIGSAVFQEIFFKLFIIQVLWPVTGKVPAVIISAFLFFGEHFVHFQAGQLFEVWDYIAQFLMSLFGGVLYLYSGMIMVPVLLHLSYNIPIAASYFYSYFIVNDRRRTA